MPKRVNKTAELAGKTMRAEGKLKRKRTGVNLKKLAKVRTN